MNQDQDQDQNPKQHGTRAASPFQTGQSPTRRGLDPAYDVVVIGGGAAGLSGALALGRSRRRVLVVDAGDPRNAPAGHVHNYLFREGMPPADLLAIGREEVAQYGVEIVAATVTAVHPADEAPDPRDGTDGYRFRVALADGRSVRTRRLLVATGVKDELPPIPGVAERWGRDVLHCPFCHGWEVRDQAIGILATGPMAVHSALMFRQLSDDVTLFQHTSPPLTAEGAVQLAARGITVVEGEVAALQVEEDRLTGVRLRSGEVVPRQAVVVAPFLAARADMLRPLGLEAAPREVGGQVFGTSVPTEAMGSTAVPGVWVAGNVADPMAQVISSAAAGLMAGAAIHGDLLAEDTANAVAEHRLQTATSPV